ncbi:MAG TPA: hypothetical protein VHO24_11835 [Opitutaceae bacterium]|nr:hypothetical protein [Opitutaceae bacterium]
MHLTEEDDVFLRGLVKTSRQKPHLVKWTDRDGSDRYTVATQPESERLAVIARRAGCSQAELLRRAAHIPVTNKPPATP